MAEEFLYVHLDSNNNSVLSMGISHNFFSQSLSKVPSNLLLLQPKDEDWEFDPHTGLHVVRGENQVKEYLYSSKKINATPTLWNWIDYTDLNLLHQLTPSELSELLYFGHTKSPLYSPFFYKLQNNFAFFDTRDGLSKVYYRDISIFYSILANVITSFANKRIIDRITFFKKTATIPPLPSSKINQIKQLLQEGVLFSFKQKELINGDYTISLTVVEEQIQGDYDFIDESQSDALLVYHHLSSSWEFLL